MRKAAIVDDDPSVRRGLGRLLRTMDWETASYASAEEFLDDGLDRHYDVVLIDIRLPGMSGVDLLQRLREKGVSSELLLMTAHGEAETRDLLLRASGAVCLRKPFSKEDFLGAIV